MLLQPAGGVRLSLAGRRWPGEKATMLKHPRTTARMASAAVAAGGLATTGNRALVQTIACPLACVSSQHRAISFQESMAKSETASFERRSPSQNRCCLCQTKEGPFQFEERLTGRDMSVQNWPYCQSCWADYQNQDGIESAEKYLGLLRAICGDYRVCR